MRTYPLFHIFLFVLPLISLPEIVFTQSVNLGSPPVLNFTKQTFHAGTQVWDIAQDSQGIMWFGNNEGLLEFDGTHWQLHPLTNKTVVRSVRVGKDGRIFVGGQDEFGYFAPESNGTLAYHSLIPLVQANEQQIGDVWNIAVRDEGVFFRTNHQVFRYNNQQLTPLFPPGNNLHFMGSWQGKLLMQDGQKKLYTFEHETIRQLEYPADFKFGTISGILSFSPDTILVSTIKNGIYYYDGTQFSPWKTKDDHFLKTNIIFCSTMLRDGKIALGTSLNGLITLDRQRRIYHHINKKSGLQNNTILSLFAADNSGIWLGLDNGIDFVDIHSPFTTIFPDGDLEGTGYTARVHKGNLYFGTNTGLYATKWSNYYTPYEKQNFTKVLNSEGQVWSLNEVEGSLLMGHHEGAFEVKGNIAQKLTSLQGVWKFLPWSSEYAIAGHYNGLALFKKSSLGWAYESTFDGLSESSRLLALDPEHNIWMAHPYRGVYKIVVNPPEHQLKAHFFGASDGLPSDVGNHLFQADQGVVFTGETGVFHFSSSQNRFVSDPYFEAIFGKKVHVRYIKQDHSGNIWYATDREMGVLKIENNPLDKKVLRMPIPELSNKQTAGFQFVLPVNDQNVFVATDNGFVHFNPSAYFANKDTVLRLVLREIKLKNRTDSVLYGGHSNLKQISESKVQLSARQNSLIFTFSSPDNPGGGLVQYSHHLEGADAGWSDWNAETIINFNHLSPGNYVFHLKAHNQHGIESNTLSFPFRINPPWYASRLAYLFYILMLAAWVVGIIKRQQRQFAKEKKGLVNLHEQQARTSEEAINRLENEKLEAEVRHKNQELASATFHIVQKNEILKSVKDALEKLRDPKDPDSKLEKEIRQIIRLLEQDIRTDADWEQFSQHFDQVHSNFLKRFSEEHASLSPNDYKLCAYLRLNLSSKEIAALMNISLRGVESSRYRLRKRLGLDTEVNLIDYLMRF